MRPRPEGRGERLRPVPHFLAGMCFNAATTRRPWRTELLGKCRQAGLDVLQCGHDPKAVENAVCRTGRASTSGGFNAATARRPWRTSLAHHWHTNGQVLQCGHDPKAVENSCHLCLRLRQPLASMRPRPEGRGERPQLVDGHPHVGVASMRPRPEGRGEPRTSIFISRWRTCCFNAATTRRPWRTQGVMEGHWLSVWLQCGHDPKAVENLARLTDPHLKREQLQCGHGPKAVENQSRCRCCRPFRRGFNAATTRRPWRTISRSLSCGRLFGFNAATTRRPWRTRRCLRRR